MLAVSIVFAAFLFILFLIVGVIGGMGRKRLYDELSRG